MDYFPIFLNLQGQKCLVVGGGDVAARKVKLLLGAGASVTVVSPRLAPDLVDAFQDGKIQHKPREFSEPDIIDVNLVIAATNNNKVNREVSDIAKKNRVPVNVVDSPELCTFVVPSIIDRSPLVAAVSTGGKSPVLARIIRARLESLIPVSYGRLAKLAAEYRDKVKRKYDTSGGRRLFWEDVLQGSVGEKVLAGREDEARRELDARLVSGHEGKYEIGEVYLIGGGPGDPDLLTFRALRLLQKADVVVHDRLVSKEVLDMARRDAERIYVGKEKDKHTLPQEDINHLLVRLAKEGKHVARLKGGDPFVFGRGGEEIETLAAEGVPFQVVPGITAASGCASYAGIPLTHRDHAQSCVLVTGHLKDGTMNLNWETLVQPNQTVVFYMGLTGLNVLCSGLIEHGMRRDMPAALVQQGTTLNQRVFVGTLETLPDIVKRSEVRAPTLIIVGEVVTLRKKLSWFGSDTEQET